MKEYLLKQLKATCVLFSIACKINLGLAKNNGNPGRRGGSLALEIRLGGVTVIQEIWVGVGVKKPCHLSGGGGWIFSGITQCKYIFWLFKDRLIIHDRAPLSNCEISLKKKKRFQGFIPFTGSPPIFFSG